MFEDKDAATRAKFKPDHREKQIANLTLWRRRHTVFAKPKSSLAQFMRPGGGVISPFPPERQ
jgi:hypothetical protein